MSVLKKSEKRKRNSPERFGEKAIAGRDYSEDEQEISIDDSSSIDGDYTPTKKPKYGPNVTLTDDEDNDISESIGQYSGEKRNFDDDMDLIDTIEQSNPSTSNIISNKTEKNRHQIGKTDNIFQLLTKVMGSISKLDEKVDQIHARVSVIENKLIDRHAKKSCDSTVVKDDDKSRKLKMYFKANCIPFTNIDDMKRFEENLDDSDFRKQAVSIYHVNFIPHFKNIQFKRIVNI